MDAQGSTRRKLATVHVLIATTGVLPPVPVADLCDKLLDEFGTITVMTAIEIPRLFIDSMADDERRSFLDDTDQDSDTAEMKALNYLEERGRRAVEPIVAALTARGHQPDVRFVEGGDPVEAIVTTAQSSGADIIVMGATKRLFTEAAWTSVSARVMERSQCPLLLVPGVRAEESAERSSGD